MRSILALSCAVGTLAGDMHAHPYGSKSDQPCPPPSGGDQPWSLSAVLPSMCVHVLRSHYGSSAAQIVLPQAWRVLPRLCTVCALFKGVVAPELTGPIINKPDGISAIAQQLQLLAQAVQQGPAPDMCLHGGCLTPQGGACWCGKLRQRLHSCRAHYRCMMAALRPALFWGHHCNTWQTS